jgi:hypothetical protein
MPTPRFILKIKNLTLATINSRTYFFTVNHITKETQNKHIYGIRLNTDNYFLSKTSGISDCEQLDMNPPLDDNVLKEIGDVMTEVELKFDKRPTTERINSEVFKILARLRTAMFRKI